MTRVPTTPLAVSADYHDALVAARRAKNWLFLLLLAVSSITSVFKVNLPIARSGSTMSVSYAVGFASLLLLGPNETMLVASAVPFGRTFTVPVPLMFRPLALLLKILLALSVPPLTVALPLLPGCSARFRCRTAFRHEGGDHEIFVGEVLGFEAFERAPLVFHKGGYAVAVKKRQPPAPAAPGCSRRTSRPSSCSRCSSAPAPRGR